MNIRPLTSEEVTFTLKAEPEDIPVRGNLICSGDSEFDKKCEDEVIARLESGDVWAWCYVSVTATWGEFQGSAALGGNSYESEADFLESNSDYYEDLKVNALEDLNYQVSRAFEKIKELIQ